MPRGQIAVRRLCLIMQRLMRRLPPRRQASACFSGGAVVALSARSHAVHPGRLRHFVANYPQATTVQCVTNAESRAFCLTVRRRPICAALTTYPRMLLHVGPVALTAPRGRKRGRAGCITNGRYGGYFWGWSRLWPACRCCPRKPRWRRAGCRGRRRASARSHGGARLHAVSQHRTMARRARP